MSIDRFMKVPICCTHSLPEANKLHHRQQFLIHVFQDIYQYVPGKGCHCFKDLTVVKVLLAVFMCVLIMAQLGARIWFHFSLTTSIDWSR